MNILQIIPELEAGGAERTTLEVAEAVSAEGGRALVASEGGRLEAELAALGGELIRLPVKSKNPWTIWRNAARLARLIEREGVDLVHARSRAPAWSAMWAARRAGRPFVTTYHGAYNARSGLKRWYNSVMARGDRVIANSEFIAGHVAAEHAVPADRVAVIPRGVDLERFDPDALDPGRAAALRRDWGVGDEEILVLLPARLTAWKGQTLAIEALAGRDGVVLVCAGDAQGRAGYVEELRNLAGARGVALRLPGHVADMPAAFAAADLVLTPSLEPEAFGRTAAEAQAMGRIVIAADHGGAREVVDAGETGWRVAPGDAAALGAAIDAALGLSPEARAAMGGAGRRRVLERFSKSALQESTLRVYRELID
ncbi:glycosyl transferase [Marinicauda salina]|uniref:Glycosyl transferase n=1 Tax=Marinicauda salina TaxID=2135793 RepID=A0A2U2BWM8_9PROT|nr:glycosyltransferase family 4 protein [Marinicauda salina]PWE18425.1 glycosyl transferase [Marinicauda salina]